MTLHLEDLKARELEVVRCVAERLSYKEIGAKLGMSHHTARVHVYSMARNIGGRGTAYLRVYAWAIEHHVSPSCHVALND